MGVWGGADVSATMVGGERQLLKTRTRELLLVKWHFKHCGFNDMQLCSYYHDCPCISVCAQE